jgi:hypothetical protein
MPPLGTTQALIHGRMCPPQYPYRITCTSGLQHRYMQILQHRPMKQCLCFSCTVDSLLLFPLLDNPSSSSSSSSSSSCDCPNLQAQLVTSICAKLKATLCFLATVSCYNEDASSGVKGLLCKRTSQLLAQALDVQLYLLQVAAHRHCLPAAARRAFVHTTTTHVYVG